MQSTHAPTKRHARAYRPCTQPHLRVGRLWGEHRVEGKVLPAAAGAGAVGAAAIGAAAGAAAEHAARLGGVDAVSLDRARAALGVTVVYMTLL